MWHSLNVAYSVFVDWAAEYVSWTHESAKHFILLTLVWCLWLYWMIEVWRNKTYLQFNSLSIYQKKASVARTATTAAVE